jgi:hypothetical protein
VRQPADLGEPRPQRVPPFELVPRREQQDHRLGRDVAGEEGEQVQRRPVSPVQVLDDEDDRPAPRQRNQTPQQPFEEPDLRRYGSSAAPARRPRAPGRPRGSRNPPVREERGDLRRPGAQHVGPLVRRQVPAPAPSTPAEPARTAGRCRPAAGRRRPQRAPVRRTREQLLDEPGLADPGLAGQDDHGAGRPAALRAASRQASSSAARPTRGEPGTVAMSSSMSAASARGDHRRRPADPPAPPATASPSPARRRPGG